jgi:hypothetical protein
MRSEYLEAMENLLCGLCPLLKGRADEMVLGQSATALVLAAKIVLTRYGGNGRENTSENGLNCRESALATVVN